MGELAKTPKWTIWARHIILMLLVAYANPLWVNLPSAILFPRIVLPLCAIGAGLALVFLVKVFGTRWAAGKLPTLFAAISWPLILLGAIGNWWLWLRIQGVS